MREGFAWDALPRGGVSLIRELNQAGFEAWFVGGCVRDLLLGIPPHDWDICTDALPEETEAALVGHRIHETGIQHGTVLVLCEDGGYEVTTYRKESGYTDHRHPDAVTFVPSLEEDLARRDFTINAMAFHPELGLRDVFGGREDLARGVLRAVGDPVSRFREDALRILRALRFAARFDLEIDEATAAAIHAQRSDLELIARERIFAELKGILTAPKPGAMLREYRDVFGTILSPLEPMFDFDQCNPHHDSDLWEHTIRVVEGVPPDAVLRMAALFHDVGKTRCRTIDEKGIGHFYGHDKISAALAQEMLGSLKCDTETRKKVVQLVRLHDRMLPQKLPGVRRFIGKEGEWAAHVLPTLRRADILGQSTLGREDKLATLERFEAMVEQAREENPCWSRAQLDLKGSDVIARGIAPGPGVGEALNRALEAVVDGKVENRRDALLRYLGFNK